MKKITLFLMLGIFFLGLNSHAQVYYYTTTCASRDLSFDTVSLNENTYSNVLLSSAQGSTIEEGRPRLPVRTFQLMIPFGKTVTNVSYTISQKKNFHMEYQVLPVATIDSTGQMLFVSDTLVYNSNNAYPASAIVSWHQEYFDGNNNIVSINVCPIEYYPSSMLLQLITSMTITVTYADGLAGGTSQIQRLQTTQYLYDSLLYHMVDNPEMVPSFRIEPTIVEELSNTVAGLPVYEYVVIAPRNLTGALHGFVTWKNQKGYRTGIVAVEDILEAYPGGDRIWPDDAIVDDAGSLRQYLHDAHALGTAFALFVGDASMMPVRYGGQVYNGIFPQVPTDIYFADLHGNWNVNGNNLYGELEDGTDSPSIMEDIYVGRLLCSNATEIANWTAKVLTYEKEPGWGNTSYLNQALLTLSRNCINGADQIINNLPCYDFFVMEENIDRTFPNGYDVVNRLNASRCGFMISYNDIQEFERCNGIAMRGNIISPTSLSYLVAEDAVDIPGHSEPDNGLDNLTNGKFPFVFYTIESNTIPFDSTKTTNLLTTRNMGESFTVGGDYGGPAYLGYTGRSIGEPNINILDEFSLLLGRASDNTAISHLGIIEAHSKHQLYSRPEYTYHALAHNLIGDPECQIWTDVPNRLSMTVNPRELDLEVNSRVEVRVTGFSTPYSERLCRVTLYSEGDVFKVLDVPVDDQGYATAVFDSIFPTIEGYVTATATCYNHIPVQYNIPVYGPDCIIDIYSDITWDTDFETCCDVIIHPNATLTVTCEVAFCPRSKVKVLPGGKLILDGGKFLSAVQGHQWQGVRVIGTGSGYQGMVNGSCAQGYVNLMNNAEINTARVALDLWNGIDIGTTGGVVIAKDANFTNNGMVVRALHFQNTNPYNGNIMAYSASFSCCNFVINENYPTEGEIFHHHVVLNEVNGVRFRGCLFHKLNCPEGMSAPDNAAIFSLDASFFVHGFCPSGLTLPCPNESLIYSYFTGFYMGINATSNYGNATFTVTNSRFGNNRFGIRTKNAAFPTILHSIFFPEALGDCCVGVYLDNTSSFTIEDNMFFGAYTLENTDSKHFGTAVINSRGINTIYKNIFADLTCANFSDLRNRAIYGTPTYHGLVYECNTCARNQYDFLIPYTDDNYHDYGIQFYQGSVSKAVGNRFSQGGIFQFYNGAPGQITYYQYEGDPDQILTNYYNVLTVSAPENGCPDHYVNGRDIVLSSAERQQRESDFYEAYTAYNGLKTVYDGRIDSGDTEALVEDIATATASEMWTLRAQLLGASPYLSKESMAATSSRDDLFPESVMFEILAANPEELSRDTLISYLEANATLPNYMIDLLKELSSTSTTYRSVLESRMIAYQQEYGGAANDIIRSIMNDSVMDPADLREWLGRLENIHADRQIIASFLDEGNDSTAFALANMLPELYNLGGEDLVEHQGYMQMLWLKHALKQDGRTIFELTDAEAVLVDSLLTYGRGVAQVMASNILEANDFPVVVDCPIIVLHDGNGNGAKGKTPNTLEDMGKALGFDVKVTPNPATTWAAIDFTLPGKATKARLTLTNMFGVKVLSDVLNGNRGQKAMDLRGLADGVYIYSVECEGLMQTGKLVIAK